MKGVMPALGNVTRAAGRSELARAGRWMFPWILVAVPISLAACGDSGGPTGSDPLDAVATVTVSPPQATVAEGALRFQKGFHEVLRKGRVGDTALLLSVSPLFPSAVTAVIQVVVSLN